VNYEGREKFLRWMQEPETVHRMQESFERGLRTASPRQIEVLAPQILALWMSADQFERLSPAFAEAGRQWARAMFVAFQAHKAATKEGSRKPRQARSRKPIRTRGGGYGR
jgi:hypothetical protein